MRASPPLSSSPVTNPLRAYSRDLDARPGATALGPSDALWLQLALALHRLGGLTADARDAYADASRSPVPSGESGTSSSSGLTEPEKVDVPSLVADLARPIVTSREETLSVLRGIVEDMENHHAFHLAFATLSAARRALPDLPPLFMGRLMAQQGRVARQLGDLDTAGDLYAMVLDLGTLHDEKELLVRGHVGAALVAETRGNFPAARSEYQAALVNEDAAPRVAASAHHGLMAAASKAGDLETAFRHAWAAFEGVAGDPVRRVDRLINLAELARKVGENRVALRAMLTAIAHTELARLRLPALSGAVHAAAALGERSTVMSLAAQAEREVAASGMPYENARILLALAQEFLELGDAERATEYARRAGEIADAHAFHEQRLRADELAQGIATRGDHAPLRESDRTARDVLRRLDALADAGRAAIVG